VKSLHFSHEQTTIDINCLNEVFRIKLKAFLPHLFHDHEVASPSDVGAENLGPPTREFDYSIQ
jgi:hypothetical protein